MSDWDAQLRRIDRRLEAVSDEALLPARGAATPEARADRLAVQAATNTWGVFLRLVLAVTLGVGILFWPYGARCGLALFGYLAAATTVAVAGVWTATWTWRHRSARGHVLSLALVAWGLVLVAGEVLPRTGYARPTAAHPATWLCP